MIVGQGKLLMTSLQKVYKRFPLWKVLRQPLFRSWKNKRSCNHMLAAIDFSSGHAFYWVRVSLLQSQRMHCVELPQCRHCYSILSCKDLSVNEGLARRHFVTYFLRFSLLNLLFKNKCPFHKFTLLFAQFFFGFLFSHRTSTKCILRNSRMPVSHTKIVLNWFGCY